jgi:hypothetical protein
MAKAQVGGGGDFENPPEAYHKARCIRAIDLGTQETTYQGKPSTPKRQLLLMFELPECTTTFEQDGEEVTRPMVISKKYTLSFSNKANLRKDMESWYGQKFNDKDIEDAGGFDPSKVVGRAAKIQVYHSTDGKYANIGVIIPEEDCPAQVHPSVVIDLDDLDAAAWNGLSERMQSWIAKSPEYQAIAGKTDESAQKQPDLDINKDDIPF